MAYVDLLINTCTVRHYAPDGGTDDYGNPTLASSDVVGNLCRLMATSGRELKVGAELVIADYKLFVLEALAITEQDEVIMNGVTYEVLFVADRQDDTSNHHKECLLRVAR